MEIFDSFLHESFKEEPLYIELRLSDKEIEYIKEIYPKAKFKKMPDYDCNDEKNWYIVSFNYIN